MYSTLVFDFKMTIHEPGRHILEVDFFHQDEGVNLHQSRLVEFEYDIL